MLFVYVKLENFKSIGFLLCFYCFCTICHGNAANEDLVKYYEDLIKTGIKKAFKYTLPTSAEEYRPKLTIFDPQNFGTYDFVVVGAGPGGSVIANRLTEEKNWNVLLIEAGGPETNFSIIPGMYPYLQGSRLNWNFKTTPQTTSCLGMIENRCYIPRGKALGGSTAINTLIYSRGSKYDYDRWGEDNDGWSYADVLPYFIKSENAQIIGDPGYHGLGGYWNVKYHMPNSEQLWAMLNGSHLIYKSKSNDYNGKEQAGSFRVQNNNYKQFRQSSNSAFLQPIKNRPNLKIITSSYVTKILIDPLTKTAYGVKFTKDGGEYYVKARKEVIISAGSISSPQILMISGIGPQRHLLEMGIPVLNNLPVGEYLYDHGIFNGLYVSSNVTAPDFDLKESVEQFLNASGPLTVALNSQGIAFYHSRFEPNVHYPDIEFKFNPGGAVPNEFVRQTLGVTDDVYNALYPKINDRTTMYIEIFVLRTQAIGKVTLGSKDPFKYPLIDSNLLGDDQDIEMMYEAIVILKTILRTKPLRKINAAIVYADYPQCRNFTMGSKGYWLCAFRLLTTSGFHQTSTCRMGPDPTDSVVNNEGKVHGINNLRVVDASIIPFALGCHTSAPTIMLAEKISDIIKSNYGLSIDPITNVNE